MAGFQQVKVNRDLEFVNFAAHSPNVKGPMMTELNIFDDHFLNDTNDGTTWTEDTEGGTIAGDGAVLGGAVTFTTGGADEDMCELAKTRVVWSAYKNCGMEARIKVDNITSICINVGFVDALNSTADQVAGFLDGAGAFSAPTVTKDFALLVYDTDEAAAWYVGASANGTEDTPVAASPAVTLVNDTYVRLRVQTNTDGDSTFYINDTAVGFLSAQIEYDSDDLLTPYVAIMERSANARVLTIDRITVWQDA